MENFGGVDVFLNRESRTLLIKGDPGTGKTTLGLQLLERFGEGNGVYVSTRVPSKKVELDLPWSGKNVGKTIQFHDLRLGNTSVLVTDFINSLQKKPVPPIIVFDSIDAITKELDDKQRVKTEKTIFALADNASSRVVFISEDSERNALDYLVDGVVELTRLEESDRVLREVEIRKLRGTPIAQHKFLFTLKDGRFRLIEPYIPPDYSGIKRAKAVPDVDAAHYSFGATSLDQVFGGLRKGGIFVLEYTEKVRYSAVRLFSIPVITNFLKMGRSVMMVPLAGSDAREIIAQLERSTGEKPESLSKRLRIQAWGDNQRTDKDMFIPATESIQEQRKVIQFAIEELRKESVDKSVLIVQSISTLETRFATKTNELLENLSSRVGRTQDTTDSLLLTIQQDSPIRTRVLAMSYDYATMFTKDKAVVIFGEKHPTPAYAVHQSDDPQKPTLTEIM